MLLLIWKKYSEVLGSSVNAIPWEGTDDYFSIFSVWSRTLYACKIFSSWRYGIEWKDNGQLLALKRKKLKGLRLRREVFLLGMFLEKLSRIISTSLILTHISKYLSFKGISRCFLTTAVAVHRNTARSLPPSLFSFLGQPPSLSPHHQDTDFPGR